MPLCQQPFFPSFYFAVLHTTDWWSLWFCHSIFYVACLMKLIIDYINCFLSVLLLGHFPFPCYSVGLASVHHVLLWRFDVWFQHFGITYCMYIHTFLSCRNKVSFVLRSFKSLLMQNFGYHILFYSEWAAVPPRPPWTPVHLLNQWGGVALEY